MNPVSTMVLSLALLFGGAGAVFAYESASQPDAPRSSVAAATPGTATDDASPVARSGRRHHHRPVVRWAPCPAGTTLVEKACVTDVVKTVSLAAPVAQAVSHSSGSSTSSHSSGPAEPGEGGDDHGDDRGEDGGGGGGEHDD